MKTKTIPYCLNFCFLPFCFHENILTGFTHGNKNVHIRIEEIQSKNQWDLGVNWLWERRITLFSQWTLISQLCPHYLEKLNYYTLENRKFLLCLHVKPFSTLFFYHLWICCWTQLYTHYFIVCWPLLDDFLAEVNHLKVILLLITTNNSLLAAWRVLRRFNFVPNFIHLYIG